MGLKLQVYDVGWRSDPRSVGIWILLACTENHFGLSSLERVVNGLAGSIGRWLEML